LIITCEQCETQFQLDDSRVPAGGVKVRCSRCKHAFFVKPGASAGDPVEQAVGRALEGESDLPGDSTQELRGRPQTQERAAGPPESWEFEHDARTRSGGRSALGIDAAREAIDDLLGGGGDAPSAPPAPASDALDELFDSDPDLGAASAWGSADDLGPDGLGSDDLDRDGLGADLADAEPAAGFGDDASGSLDLDGPAAFAADAPRARAGAAAPAQDGLGNPDSWDFFAAEGAAQAAPPATGMRIALGRLGEVRPRQPLAPMDVADSEPSQVAVWAARAGHAAGWLATGLLCAFALHRSLPAAPLAATATARSQSLGPLEARDVSGRWLENAVAGDVFVVSGLLGATADAGRGPGVRLVVRLVDADGHVLEQEAAPVGPALAESRLREESPRALRVELDRGSRALAWEPLRAGETRSFQALLAAVPERARGFELVAIPLEAPAPASPESAAEAAASDRSPAPAG
jgi:predicted Zn finger-like uncharacterized protein